ncbi:MAG: KOW motif domain-containing protein [Ruminococcus sp.]|nr:KOW motif domain-containing protein [Ruminococcus sp.]MCM1381203.1 KOW motif domain-containing protein [Muribaculaceae bacterium]MCM1478727.1 KOW motif domain-containing protein [Muribaculaceae bacterium]
MSNKFNKDDYVLITKGREKGKAGKIKEVIFRGFAKIKYYVLTENFPEGILLTESALDETDEEHMTDSLERRLKEYDMLKEKYPRWYKFIPHCTDCDKFIGEMSAWIYPKYNEDYNIESNRFKAVVYQDGEGSVPHVHVYYESEETAYISLGKAEYVPQHKEETKLLNEEEKRDLQRFFETFRKGAYTKGADGKPVPCSCWQECVDVWLETYDTDVEKYFDIDKKTETLIMPDYTQLKP